MSEDSAHTSPMQRYDGAPALARDSLRRRTVRALADAVLPPAVLVRRARVHERKIALTFDDGPDPLTRAYLDVLDAHGATATFFVLGGPAASRRDDLLEIVRRGHEVAGHGFTHRRFTMMSGAELDEELTRTAALLPPAQGRRALLRPPQGHTSVRSLARCTLAGYTTVLWSLDSHDCRTQDAAAVAANVAPERVVPGDIVLLHEGQSWTLAALPRLLDGLRGAGYTFATVGELLRG